ncbi:KICSTOR complex protein ITFG2-like [Physella acuta]|uniref:KICSTOR complex protein ITFG2-like n=1 Tax=Physella acuta TaxID=109671 RepID=UPI0027DC1E5C|nr:KICSTOR complex protein ITFG2-like [Physella acuta]XP_059170643.1 KICSTOR complex protein ITFG2-like [Physella acuta]
MANDLTNSIMRTVSFVERIEFEFPGNIMTQAMVLADVDNDMSNELVVGNIEGDIAIFKGDSPTPWKKTTICGMLTCLAVGEVHLPKKNSLVCMTAEGWCCIYDIKSKNSAQSMTNTEEEGEGRMSKPFFTQELPANAKVMCLADIDSDGCVEMVIGYSDRVVRAFRWQETHESDSGQFVLIQRWQLAGQIGSITINYNKEHQPEVMVSQPGAALVSLQLKTPFRHIKSDSCLDRMACNKQDHMPERSGSFITTVKSDSSGANCGHNPDAHMSKSDTLYNQSADLSSNKCSNHQSSDKYSSLFLNKLDSKTPKQGNKQDAGNKSLKSENSPEQKDDKQIPGSPTTIGSNSPLESLEYSGNKLSLQLNHDTYCDEEMFNTSFIYHPLAHKQTRNKDTSTVIVGGINRERSAHSTSDAESQLGSTYYALATLDGSLILVENDSILWSLQVDHYLFALAKLDVTGNGQEEVVCCSWSGQTYIANHSKEIVRYQFPDSVAAFCAGYFSLQEGSNAPCFVYATFNNKIYIYPNIKLPRVESTNLLQVMSRKKETHELLEKLNIDPDNVDSVRKLYHWCLYGQHGKSQMVMKS